MKLSEGFFKFNFNITIKILLFVATLIILQGLVLYYSSSNIGKSLLKDALEEKGITIARSIGKSCQLQILVGDYQSLQKLIDSFKREHGVTFIHIYDGKGNLLSSTENIETVEYSDITMGQVFELQIYYLKLPRGEDVMNIHYPIFIDELEQDASFGDVSGSMGGPDLLGEELMPDSSMGEVDTSTAEELSRGKIGVVKIQLSLTPLQQRISRTKTQFLYISTLNFLIIFVIVLISMNRIIKPFNEIIEMLQYISSSNDLTKRVELPRQREMRILGEAFNKLIDALSFQIKNTKEVALQIAQSISPILTASDEQEEAAREQVSAVTQTITSMAELSQSSRLINQNSLKVNTYSDSTLKSAQEGVEAVNEVVEAISQIDDSSKTINNSIVELAESTEQIQQIMAIIKEFTEQTKLIAFNAAIEASSAKVAGRRFGVVATEVRKLAGDIETSSKDISKVLDKIQDTRMQTLQASHKNQDQVSNGVHIAADAKNAITRIFQAVEQTTKITKQISNYTTQQISANDEVVRAVKEILSLAERSMENAKQTTMVTETLSALSTNLTEMVEKFKI